MKTITILFIIFLGLFNQRNTVVASENPAEGTPKEQLESYDIKKKVIVIPGIPNPIAPYNPAIEINHILYLSGQIGIDPATRQLISDDVQSQTKQAFHNIQAILDVAGSDLTQIVRCLVLLTDINDYQSMNQIYTSFFRSNKDYPARTTFAVQSLPANAKVEIECTAYAGRKLVNCYERLIIPSNFILFSLAFHLVVFMFIF